MMPPFARGLLLFTHQHHYRYNVCKGYLPLKRLNVQFLSYCSKTSLDGWRETSTVGIVGGGPVGLTLAYLLDKYNVKCIVLERSQQSTSHPQAHFINLRTMEIFQIWMKEVYMDIMSMASPYHSWENFSYCCSLSGTQLGTSNHFPSSVLKDLESTTIGKPIHMGQNVLENILSRNLRQHTKAQLLVGHEFIDAQINQNGVFTKVYNQQTQEFLNFHFQYLIGADGAHSSVRKQFSIPSIPMIGLNGSHSSHSSSSSSRGGGGGGGSDDDDLSSRSKHYHQHPQDHQGSLRMKDNESVLQHIVNIHFTSKKLLEITKNKNSMLYFVFNKDVICILIAHCKTSGEWVCQVPYYPPQQELEDFTEKVCKTIISQAAGTFSYLDDLKINSVGSWEMKAQIAKTYSIDNRIFLVGDAAHQFPPAGGLGMNTGIQDAHNLAWKLASVCNKKEISSDLLKSYQEERMPIAKTNAKLSLINYQRTLRVPQALGLSIQGDQILKSTIQSDTFRMLSPNMQKSFVNTTLQIGRYPLTWIENPFHPFGNPGRLGILQLLKNNATLGLLFPAFDLGFKYPDSSCALIKNPNAFQYKDNRDLFSEIALNDIRFKGGHGGYFPSTCPGAVLPHFWIQDAQTEKIISTLTLSIQNNSPLSFTLLLADKILLQLQNNSSGSFQKIKHLNIAAITTRRKGTHNYNKGKLRNDHEDINENVHYFYDQDAKWNQFCENLNTDALLLRPDGHIASTWYTNSYETCQFWTQVYDCTKKIYALKDVAENGIDN